MQTPEGAPLHRGEACGKVILLGEHAVVYGAPALAAGIERGARATAEALPPSAATTLTLGSETVQPDRRGGELSRALDALLWVAPAAPPLRLSATAELPPGGGLGCSAALGVALARAVEAAMGLVPDADRVAARAEAWERVFHGNPSGVDTAAARLGGCFRFAKQGGVRPLTLPRDLWLCVGWTGVPSSTKTMVEDVARMAERRPKAVADAVRGITSLVDNACLAAEAADLTGLGRLMDLNQMLLSTLMVSTEAIEEMCTLARGAGALGAKLTGAGGGGSVIALVASARLEAPDISEPLAMEAAERVLAAWRGAGYDGFTTRVRASAIPERPRSAEEGTDEA